ncbi:DUF2911 domain-containing protein [Arenibacter sp. GZD96]|uniref:DUF2911 domain-containing protein n=1 Tax=Aurantibrevibacter litoralis TaxID=3106030 RepID=UPI002AFDD9F3|nr:DUF2911 domain-containing protein [Arenibacter sp. GZD-96]MEA1785763.1 DUF2911 domain-containing protein [Arenibacter sp. GZD-96]
MKKYVSFIVLSVFVGAMLNAQELRGLDKSPMDMAYFPDDYAHDRRFAPEKLTLNEAYIRVIYSRPAKKDRTVFGELVPYDKVWRTGANEAPEIKFYKDITLNGKKVKAGSYALLSIPNKDSWTIILSKDVDQWGHYSYDENKDVIRVKATVSRLTSPVEDFTIQFYGEKGAKAGEMWLAWDETLVTLPFSF